MKYLRMFLYVIYSTLRIMGKVCCSYVKKFSFRSVRLGLQTLELSRHSDLL